MWQSKFKGGMLLVVGVGIGFNGAVVTFAPGRMQSTYGIAAQNPDVTVLVRHRGLLLLLVGLLLAVSGVRRELRPVAVASGATSMATFVLFTLTSATNAQQRHIAWVDVGLLALLGAAVAISDRTTASAGLKPT